jgi:hypothetical protein
MYAPSMASYNDKTCFVMFDIVAIFYQNILLGSVLCGIIVDDPSPLFSHHGNFLRKFNAALAGR